VGKLWVNAPFAGDDRGGHRERGSSQHRVKFNNLVSCILGHSLKDEPSCCVCVQNTRHCVVCVVRTRETCCVWLEHVRHVVWGQNTSQTQNSEQNLTGDVTSRSTSEFQLKAELTPEFGGK
jgi:hypothetical protein